MLFEQIKYLEICFLKKTHCKRIETSQIFWVRVITFPYCNKKSDYLKILR